MSRSSSNKPSVHQMSLSRGLKQGVMLPHSTARCAAVACVVPAVKQGEILIAKRKHVCESDPTKNWNPRDPRNPTNVRNPSA